jgi:hypothetical protein
MPLLQAGWRGARAQPPYWRSVSARRPQRVKRVRSVRKDRSRRCCARLSRWVREVTGRKASLDKPSSKIGLFPVPIFFLSRFLHPPRHRQGPAAEVQEKSRKRKMPLSARATFPYQQNLAIAMPRLRIASCRPLSNPPDQPHRDISYYVSRTNSCAKKCLSVAQIGTAAECGSQARGTASAICYFNRQPLIDLPTLHGRDRHNLPRCRAESFPGASLVAPLMIGYAFLQN